MGKVQLLAPIIIATEESPVMLMYNETRNSLLLLELPVAKIMPTKTVAVAMGRSDDYQAAL
jgi:hypothetical protein